ncbi:T9SS type A sorting domain-containing protein [Lacinutrix algicola]|uniref:T9SS type A sorting domain-containing protein n=1 Tax=Lacinutrix algicola TaxID=342954 RepID=UPI0006E20F0E|nr:T9SS type A sorting domain-containing protein [Lacinutrix algicola]
MKQTLLLFLTMSYSVIIYGQAEIQTVEKSVNVYTLEEVELEASRIKTKTITSIRCCYSDTMISRCSTYCTVKGVLIGDAFAKREVNNLKLYPNPSTNGIFQINFNKKNSEIKVIVNSISGQVIQSNVFHNVLNKVTVDLSQYPSGIYLINIIADGKRLTVKKAIRG